MKKHLLTLCIALVANAMVFAQEAKEEKKEGWFRTAGLGLDAGQLNMINPRVGAGENRINFGGAANVSLNYKKGRIAWDNGAAAIFGVQKLGSGIVALGGTKKPFQKSADELRLNSKVGYSIKPGGKLYLAGDLSALTQLTPTYKNNLLSDINNKGINDVVSQFFSPAIITFAVGLDYKPTPKLSFFYSPISLRGTIVQNDDITLRPSKAGATQNLFGVDVDKNSLFDLGSLARGVYTNKFLKDKLVVNSNLGLFGAYKSGKGIKVDWANQIAWDLFKGFQLGLNVNVFYDKNILVQVSDNNGVGGIKRDAKGDAILDSKPSITQQLLLKYAKTF